MGGLENFGDGPATLGLRLVTPSGNTLLLTCYRTTCDSSMSNRLGVGMGVPKLETLWLRPGPPLGTGMMGSQKIGDAGAPLSWKGTWLTPKTYAPPGLCYHANFGHYRSNCTSVIMEIGYLCHMISYYAQRDYMAEKKIHDL